MTAAKQQFRKVSSKMAPSSICLLLLLAGNTMAVSIHTNPGARRTLCCATAQNDCSQACAGQPCSESCTATCGIFNTNCGTWSCNDIAGFSCTRTTTSTTTQAAPACGVATACPSPPAGAVASTYYSGTCYSVFSGPSSWYDARTACQSLGGSLAAVTNDCTQERIQDDLLSTAVGTSLVWTGGSISPPETSYSWVSGDTPTPSDFNNFVIPPPTDSTSCISINPSNGNWETGTCTSLAAYICQTS